MKTSFINNIFNSQPILIKCPLKFFSDTFTFDLRFPLKTRIYAPGDLRYKKNARLCVSARNRSFQMLVVFLLNYLF